MMLIFNMFPRDQDTFETAIDDPHLAPTPRRS